jgi:hypothetical protein
MTGPERRLDAAARRVLVRLPDCGIAGVLVELLAFGAKQAGRACSGRPCSSCFSRPGSGIPTTPSARNDALTLAALGIQVSGCSGRGSACRCCSPSPSWPSSSGSTKHRHLVGRMDLS